MRYNRYFQPIETHMRKLKISFVACLFVSIISAVNAQQINLEAGYFNPKQFKTTAGENYFDAARIGATVLFPWKYNLSLQSGLLYNIGLSTKKQLFPHDYSVNYTTWSHSAEIPLRVHYSIPLGKQWSLFGFAGPNLQIGIIQYTQIDANLNTILTQMSGIESGNINMYQDNLHRINLQLGAGGGVQWKKYSLKGGYDWGMNNLNKLSDSNIYQKNWFVSFGYQIK